MKFRNFEKYEVFEDGRIWSYKTNSFLKPATMTNGYQRVCLTDNEGKRKTYLVHRVVYEAVSGKPIPSGMQINHISEAKNDSRFENLNLMSPKENNNWGTRNERARKSISKSMTNNTKISKQVGAFQNGELVMTFPSTRECGRQGFCQVAVAACCRNCYIREGNNVYKGFTWKYI